MNIKSKWFYYIILILSFLCFTVITLSNYIKHLDNEFEMLIEENLTSYANNQKNEVINYISEISTTLNAISTLIEDTDADLNSSWIREYLDNISDKEKMGEVTCYYINEVESYFDDGTIDIMDKFYFKKLMLNENIISEIRFSQRYDDYYFGIGVPIIKNNEVVGFLKSLNNASVLVKTKQENKLSEVLKSFIVDKDGNIINIEKNVDYQNANMYDLLSDYNIAQESILKIKDDFLKKESGYVSLGKINDQYYHIAYSSLNINGWHIVNFVHTSIVKSHSDAIIKITLTMLFIVCFMLIIAFIIIMAIQKRQDGKLAIEKEKYYMLSYFSDTCLFEYYFKENYLDFSENVKNLLAVKKLRVDNYLSSESTFKIVHPKDKERIKECFFNLPKEDETVKKEFRFLGVNLKYIWCQCTYKVIYDNKNNPVILMGIIENIDKRKEMENKLLIKSKFDALTNIYNKITVESKINDILNNSSFKSGILFVIDIDNFKSVNDNLGHIEGDKTLCNIAQMLKEIFFDERDIIGRIGGDEFIAFIPYSKNNDLAIQKASKICSDIGSINFKEYEYIKISASVGICIIEGKDNNYIKVFKQADNLMYEAKRNGKNSYRIGNKKGTL